MQKTAIYPFVYFAIWQCQLQGGSWRVSREHPMVTLAMTFNIMWKSNYFYGLSHFYTTTDSTMKENHFLLFHRQNIHYRPRFLMLGIWNHWRTILVLQETGKTVNLKSSPFREFSSALDCFYYSWICEFLARFATKKLVSLTFGVWSFHVIY